MIIVFAYGSLQTDFWNHRPFAPWLLNSEPGVVVGLELLHLPQGYPAAFSSIDKEAQIFGEIQVFRPDPRLLSALDAMEDYHPHDPASSMYVRTRVQAHRLGGDAPEQAWCYLYAAATREQLLSEGATPVPAGDWRAFMRGRKK